MPGDPVLTRRTFRDDGKVDATAELSEARRRTLPQSAGPRETIVLEPGRQERHYWRDLWEFRELLQIFAWRDITVRYKQTVLGILWAVVRPFTTMVVFTVIFGNLADLPSDGGAPYAIMVYAAMLPWFLFSGIISQGSSSIVANTALIGRIYFPRAIIPLSASALPFVDFAISFGMLGIIMLWFGYAPGWEILLLPFFVGLAFVVALGPAFLFTALNVKYRDLGQVVPFLLQLGLYISPVGFSSGIVPDEWRFWYSLNPIVGVIDGFRWCVLGGESDIYLPGFIASLVIAGLLLWLGVRYFRRTERTFADFI